MSALDKFKRRLVRDIARRIYQEKQSEDEMWQQLKQEYGCDCHLLWEHMRALTLKKLKRLLAAEDRIGYITRIARMTSTDWLTFDLVLVHEKVDVIGEDMTSSGKPEPEIFIELLNLVEKYGIEVLAPKFLVDAWFNLTIEYNTGGRQCSPMLLQRRWYQLKESTRSKFYNFWQNYRGNPKLLPKASENKPTKVQMMIAERFQKVITQPFLQWENLIQMKRVVQAGAFESRRRIKESEISNSENDPDLIVVEPTVETIDVAADSDNEVTAGIIDKLSTNDDISKVNQLQHEEDLGVTIKTESTYDVTEVEEECAINELENILIPVESGNHVLEDANVIQDSCETMTVAAFKEPSELTLPKITSVMGNVDIPLEFHTEINETDYEKIQGNVDKTVAHDEKYLVYTNNSHNGNMIKEKNNEVSENQSEDAQISFKTDVSTNNFLKENATDLDNSNKMSEEQSEDIKSFLKKEVVPNFDELPIDLEFVDDGIELVDNDVEYVGEDRPVNVGEGDDIKTEIKQEAIDEVVGENDASFKIDQKLIMFPITFTKKLDDMIIFKNTSYFQVKGDDIIQRILNESKPTLIAPVKQEQINEDESDGASETSDVPRVKYTSWLLKKPKFRSYNPIQLCKNPDFNTRLKRLTVGFFSFERNRKLFSACKPVTIDLHKAFEMKLVNNTLHLESSETPFIKQEKSDVCENTASVIPSAIPVQSLLDNSKVSVEELLPAKEETDVSNTPVNNYCVIERSRSINLPDIEEIRRVNQKLLTAEVSPIPLKNNLAYNKPPVQLVKPVDEDKINSHLLSTSNANHENPSNVEEEKKKRFMKRTLPTPKIRSSRTIPSWSIRVPQERTDDDTMLTEDTLNKVLCLLNGNDEPSLKLKHKKGDDTLLKEQEANQVKSNELNEANKQAVNNEISVNVSGVLIDDTEMRQSVAFLKHSNDSKKKRSKKNIAKPNRTIATQSGYCCWAQYKIQNFTQYGRRLRHLCPKPLCNCCCRNLLLNKMLHPENTSDSNVGTCRTEKRGQLSDDLFQKNFDVNKHISDYENNININAKFHTAPTTQVVTIDSITPGASSDSSIHFPLSNITPLSLDALQSEIETNEALSALVSLKESSFSEDCNSFEKDIISEKTVQTQVNLIQESKPTEDVDGETNPKNEMLSKTPKRLMKTKIVSAVNYSPQYETKVAVEKQSKKQNLFPDSAPINVDQRIRIEECSHIETITLDDDEITDIAVMATNMDTNNMLLPKGVNLLLLPDNTLSVSIDAGMQIDQGSLANLPEILTAVQKHLAETGIMQVFPEDAVLNIDDSCEINDTVSMLATSETQIKLAEDNSQNIPKLNNEHSSYVPENSNSETNNLKTPDEVESNSQSVLFQLLNTQSNITTQTTENHTETKDETVDIIQENTCDISIQDTNRKTILSDLMTLSGISPEDAFTPIEESPQYSVPKLVPLSIPSSSNTVMDNINKDDQSKLKKPIKRIKISIRKIGRKNLPKGTESVIDLTNDCDNSVEVTEKNGNHSESESMQPLIKKYVVDVKHLKPNVSNDAQPLRLFKTVRPRILKKVFPQMLQLNNLDKKVKNAFSKFYLPPKVKQPYIKILPKSAIVKHTTDAILEENLKNIDEVRNSGQGKEKHKKICEIDSDSSDDEPLAKKIKRIKDLTTNNSDESSAQINNITAAENYNVPVEFIDVPPQITDKTVSESEGEENCILGV